MRETRPSGLEGGATELNRSFLPLSGCQENGHFEAGVTPKAGASPVAARFQFVGAI